MPRRADLRSAWAGYSTAWAIIGTLLAGIIAWGGIGLVVDLLAGLRWVFLPIGMVLGVGLAIYIVYLRYGRDEGTRQT